MFSIKQICAGAGITAALFGLGAGLVSAGAGAEASPTPEPQPRPALKVVPFSTEHPEETARLASVPASAVLAPVEPTSTLRLSPGGRALGATERPGGPIKGGVTVKTAVELPRAASLQAFKGPGLTRVNYRSVADLGGTEYRATVFQPSAEDAVRGIEAPGDLSSVEGTDVYNAYSEPGLSWATSIESNGTIVTVAGGTDPTARLVVARELGLIE